MSELWRVVEIRDQPVWVQKILSGLKILSFSTFLDSSSMQIGNETFKLDWNQIFGYTHLNLQVQVEPLQSSLHDVQMT